MHSHKDSCVYALANAALYLIKSLSQCALEIDDDASKGPHCPNDKHKPRVILEVHDVRQ